MRTIIIEISNEDLDRADMAGCNTQTLAKKITTALNSEAGHYMPEDSEFVFFNNLKAKAFRKPTQPKTIR